MMAAARSDRARVGDYMPHTKNAKLAALVSGHASAGEGVASSADGVEGDAKLGGDAKPGAQNAFNSREVFHENLHMLQTELHWGLLDS